MTPSPLNRLYRWRNGVMQAAFANYPNDWSYAYVPPIKEAAATPGELEAIIAARDAAVTKAMEVDGGKAQ